MKKQKKMEALAAAEQADEEIKQDSEAPEEGKSRKDDDK
jgi:hypothetical protein